MCAKFNQVLAGLIPKGPIKEAFRSSYYSLYYNRKHFKENDFCVYYRGGNFEYAFENKVRFKSHQNMADELKRSLKGYLAEYSLKPGDIVIDCGAFIGEFTLFAAKAVGPSGRVIAFEPNPKICEQLEANIVLNGLKNITVINKGLWSKDGMLKFVGDSEGDYSFVFTDGTPGAIEAPVVSLDNELARLGIKRVDFIKADIEGAELELIKGSEGTLDTNDLSIAAASYHTVDGKKSCFTLENMLMLLGYKAHTGHPGHLTTYARKG